MTTVPHKASARRRGNPYRASFVLRRRLPALDLILLPLTFESVGGQGGFAFVSWPRISWFQRLERRQMRSRFTSMVQNSRGKSQSEHSWEAELNCYVTFKILLSPVCLLHKTPLYKYLYHYLANFGTFTFGSKFSFSSKFYLLPTNYSEI